MQCSATQGQRVPHAVGRNVLCWSHSQVSPPIKRGDPGCLAEKIWKYLVPDFSFQIWSSRAQFERLPDLSPNVCRRWLISYFLEKQTVRVVNFTHSYLWICFVSHCWLLSNRFFYKVVRKKTWRHGDSKFATRNCRWLLSADCWLLPSLSGLWAMEGLGWTGPDVSVVIKQIWRLRDSVWTDSSDSSVSAVNSNILPVNTSLEVAGSS